MWHFQVTPNDNWDYTGVQQLVLAELEIDGVPRDVIMQAPKNGFYFVLDRHTGELISAEPYASINWATHWDYATNRPVETDIASYQNYENGTILIARPGRRPQLAANGVQSRHAIDLYSSSACPRALQEERSV